MDPALLQRFRSGDRAALENVYRAEVESVENFLRVRLLRARRFSAATLADLVQEVFLRAFSAKGRAGYDGVREYRPYLLVLTRNLLIDWLRRTGRESLDPVDVEALVDAEVADGEGGEIFEPELVSVTARYVAGLEPTLSKVHEHRFVRGEAQVSTAESLGISRETLRRLERELVDGLRRMLRREGGAEINLPIRQRRSRSAP